MSLSLLDREPRKEVRDEQLALKKCIYMHVVYRNSEAIPFPWISQASTQHTAITINPSRSRIRLTMRFVLNAFCFATLVAGYWGSAVPLDVSDKAAEYAGCGEACGGYGPACGDGMSCQYGKCTCSGYGTVCTYGKCQAPQCIEEGDDCKPAGYYSAKR